MNAEFQRIGRTDKKAFFSEQCQEMEANIEWERLAISKKKTNKHKKTWRYQFHAKMGTIKDRNGKDLTEVEEIKNRWQEYTREYTKKLLMTWITTMLWSLS